MQARVRAALGSRFGVPLLLAATFGLLLFVVITIWTSRRQETIILHVQEAGDPNLVRVYVGGEVHQPGIYTLTRGSRVADAIAAAGGLTDAADVSTLGMAAVLEDADQIIVAAPAYSQLSNATVQPFQGGPVSGAPINVNSASAAQLEQLPGIGPAIAARIVEYRQRNGPFRTVDELVDIEGISERMVETLRPLVTVGP